MRLAGETGEVNLATDIGLFAYEDISRVYATLPHEDFTQVENIIYVCIDGRRRQIT